MKKFSKILFLGLAISAFAAVNSNAQLVVKIRPVVPRALVVTRRPPPPSRNHVWVDGEWGVVGGRYQYRQAHWELPPRGQHSWNPGHWRESARKGQVWVPGHWRA